MTTIKMHTISAGPNQPIAREPGDIITIDDSEAADLIAGGFAEEVQEQTPGE